MTDIRSLERTLLDTTVEQSPHQICSPISPGSLCHADGQSFDPGHRLLRSG